MKLDRNKIFSFMLAAAFALTLAGCGGGGGTATAPEPEPTPMPEPTAQEMCEGDGGRYNADGSCTSAADLAEEMALSDAQGAASMAASAAMAAVAGAVDPVAAANAYSYAKMAADASEMADAAMTSADAMGHQMAAETARDKAMEAAGMRGLGITREANQITNQTAIDNAVLEGKTGDDVPKPVSNAARVGTELNATAAEEAARTAVTDSGPGSVSQGAPAVSTTVAHGASGPTFTVAGVGTTLRLGESPVGVLETRGGWMGRELVENAASDTHVMAFTDIQAPTMRQNYGETTTGTDGNDAALAVGHIITGDIPGDGSTFAATRNVSATDNIPTQNGRVFCPADTACSISVDEDGEIVAVQGYGWQAQISGTTPATDADYLAWGVWLTVPDGTADTDVAAAGAFASGNDVFTVNEALKGTATYNGVASGVYSAGGMVEYFDADVSLMANFGGTEGADSDADTAGNDGLLLGAVTGTVSGIKAGGMDVAGSLTLKRAPVLTSADNDPSTLGFGGDVSGTLAGRAMVGEWGGQFYGPNKASGKGIETEYPTTAAGTFGASAPGNVNDPIRILGAFGTWKAD